MGDAELPGSLPSQYREFVQYTQVRCVTCGVPIARYRGRYERLIKDGRMTKQQALDEVGLKKYCCRGAMLEPISLAIGIQFDHSGITGGSTKSDDAPISSFPIAAMNSKSQRGKIDKRKKKQPSKFGEIFPEEEEDLATKIGETETLVPSSVYTTKRRGRGVSTN